MLPVISFKSANSQLSSSTSNKRTATLPDKTRACNAYDDVIRCEVPPPNLNSANIFSAWFGVKLPNLMTANISSYAVFVNMTEWMYIISFFSYLLHKSCNDTPHFRLKVV